MKVLFILNDDNQAEEMKAFLSTQDTFGDETDCISKEQFGLDKSKWDGWELIVDDKSKTDCLVLDLVDCYSDHGSIKKPKVSHAVDRDIEGEAPEKLCENCGAICHLAVKECPECGYVFPVKDIEDNANKKMVQVDTAEKYYCKSCDKQYYMDDLDTVLTSNKAYSARCPIGHELSASRFAKLTEAMPLTTVGYKFHETVSRKGNQMILLNYYGRNGMCHYLVDFYYVLSVPWALEKYLRIKNNIPAHINVRFEKGYAKARGL